MSSLTTTTINTRNGTTNLTLQSGNTSGPRIVVGSGNEGLILAANTSANALIINSSGISANLSVFAPSVNTNYVGLSGSSIAASGHTRLPNGLLMQWGTVSASSSSGTITFSTPFAAQPYSIQLTSQTNTVLGEAITATTTTTASVRTANVSAATFYYLAIGV